MNIAQTLAENLANVSGRIAEAARQAGRSADGITLVGVTKYVDAALARTLVAAGVHNLGESRPQQLWSKATELAGEAVAWHLIGSLQRNKVRRTLELAHLIHSLDSERLANVINDEAADLGRTVNVLLEVNISGDATKHGVARGETLSLLNHVVELPHLRLRGLMTMSHREGSPEIARRDFAALRELRDHLLSQAPRPTDLTELSMGMSDDFEQAILEGATIVRIGSALFEGIES